MEATAKRGVRVVVRTRPTATFAADNLAIDSERSKIQVTLRPHQEGTLDNRRSSWNFQFDDVLHNASQETVYTTCVKPIVASVMEGVNGTIMAYGQTGAGKSFTMVGDTSNFRHRGVSPRAPSVAIFSYEASSTSGAMSPTFTATARLAQLAASTIADAPSCGADQG